MAVDHDPVVFPGDFHREFAEIGFQSSCRRKIRDIVALGDRDGDLPVHRDAHISTHSTLKLYIYVGGPIPSETKAVRSSAH